jgi:hypothetical protein
MLSQLIENKRINILTVNRAIIVTEAVYILCYIGTLTGKCRN